MIRFSNAGKTVNQVDDDKNIDSPSRPATLAIPPTSGTTRLTSRETQMSMMGSRTWRLWARDPRKRPRRGRTEKKRMSLRAGGRRLRTQKVYEGMGCVSEDGTQSKGFEGILYFPSCIIQGEILKIPHLMHLMSEHGVAWVGSAYFTQHHATLFLMERLDSISAKGRPSKHCASPLHQPTGEVQTQDY